MPVSHLIRVGEFEFPAVAGPADDVLTGGVSQQLQKKLPQLNGAAPCAGAQTHTGLFTVMD